MNELNTNEKIVTRYLEEEMKDSYLSYAMSVIVGRALPDIRDGLKPVQRRILFSMHELHLKYNTPHKKCARIVGECMGKYHPHGDSSVYGALVRMAQDFSLRYPLINGQGNFGSIDGDPPAAMRYSEAKMERISNYFLQDIEKETVTFFPNFDNKKLCNFPNKIEKELNETFRGWTIEKITDLGSIRPFNEVSPEKIPIFWVELKTTEYSRESDDLYIKEYNELSGLFNKFEDGIALAIIGRKLKY